MARADGLMILDARCDGHGIVVTCIARIGGTSGMTHNWIGGGFLLERESCTYAP